VREGARGKRPAETPTPRPWAYLTPGGAREGGKQSREEQSPIIVGRLLVRLAAHSAGE